MYKLYGITGMTVMVRTAARKETKEEPWAGMEVPMKIIGEYPNFLVTVVLPHHNVKGAGMSHPYPTSIHKNDIATGAVIINGGDIR